MADRNFFWAVIHMNGPGGGWSEKYALKPDSAVSRTAAKAIGTELATRRALSLASGCDIIWGRISKADTPKDASKLLSGRLFGGRTSDLLPVGGIPAEEYTNNVQAALHYRCETEDGKWSNRLLRGVPDEAIHGGIGTLVAAGNVADTVAYTTFADAAAFETKLAMKNFLTFIKRNTMIAQPEFEVVDGLRRGTGNFTLLPISEISFRKVGSHDTGRPFGFSPGRAKATV